MNLLKQLKKPKVRASAESTLVASANVPDSGLTFVDNSQGFSAAVAELSKLLDVALDQLDFDGEPSDQLQLHLKRLYDEAGKYSNSHVDESTHAEEWECTSHEAEIVSTAFTCAAAAYQPESEPYVPGFLTRRESHVTPSIGGTIKATDFFVVERSDFEGATPNLLLPMMVVAIRGTASRVDRMVNLNGESKEMDLSNPKDPKTIAQKVSALAGFLHGAESLMPTVLKSIDDVARKNSVKHVLFTGHSAGGSVASIIFAKLMSLAETNYPSLTFSMVSFGAPPVTSSAIVGNSWAPSTNRGLVLSLVNEYDLVPRADQAYIRSLVDLYRSIYSLPPIQDIDSRQDAIEFQLPRLSFDPRNDALGKRTDTVWSLPRPVYWHIGKIVVLKVRLGEKKAVDEEDEWVLRALTVAPEDFARLLFCNVDIHKRLRYQERVDMLLEGRFNGRAGW